MMRRALVYVTSNWEDLIKYRNDGRFTIDSTLGLRSKVYGYQYSEIIRSLMCVYFCGGSCVEDVSSHLMENDYTSTDRDIVEYYNKRGGAERILDDMNNGFGWKWLPKSFMMENTVFTKSTYEAVLQFT